MEDSQEQFKYIVNGKTGEIEKKLYQGDRVLRKSQLDYSKNHKEELEEDKIYNFGQDKKFSMLSEFSAKQLADEKLTSSEYRILLLMISNTRYKSGVIGFKNNQPMTQNWISKKLGISKKTTENSIRTLIDRGIIAQNITNHRIKYFFNPYIQYRGRWINKTLYEMFKNTKWAKRD